MEGLLQVGLDSLTGIPHDRRRALLVVAFACGEAEQRGDLVLARELYLLVMREVRHCIAEEGA